MARRASGPGPTGPHTSEPAVAVELDLRGLKCPLPVLRSRKAMRTIGPGTLVRVRTTDPLAGIDIPHFCTEDGHRLVESTRDGEGHVFLIARGTA